MNITINIKGELVRLTVEEARELFYVLDNALEQIDEIGMEEE